MVVDAFKYKMLAGLFDLAGQVISSQITNPNWDEQEKAMNRYYTDAKQVARGSSEKELVETKRKIDKIVPELEKKAEEAYHETIPSSDLTPEKISGGVACLPCSRDHFSMVSGDLNEAVRFALRDGIGSEEVQKRVGHSLDELNALERWDLASENIVNLKGKEKQLAEYALSKSRELRHDITEIKSTDGLERASAKASELRTEFMRNLWDIATIDGSVSKLCERFDGEEKARCMNVIDEVLLNKKINPP